MEVSVAVELIRWVDRKAVVECRRLRQHTIAADVIVVNVTVERNGSLCMSSHDNDCFRADSCEVSAYSSSRYKAGRLDDLAAPS